MTIAIFKVTQAEGKSTPALACNYTNAMVEAKIVAGAEYLANKGASAIGGVCVDQSENVYISDSAQHIIVKVSEGGKVSVVAGVAGASGDNGTLTVAAATARFNAPQGLAMDRSGNLIVADTGNHQIRLITGGKVAVLAGGGDASSGYVSGAAHTARFNTPTDVAVLPNGDVVVCDKTNHAIRKIKGGTVVTVAGGATGDAESVLATEENEIFASPEAVDVDRNGNIWVVDTGNDKIKKIDQRGFVYLMGGNADGKRLGSTALTSEFKSLKGICVDPSGNVYVVDRNDTSGGRILRITQHADIGVVADFNESTSFDAGLLGIAASPAGKLFVVTGS